MITIIALFSLIFYCITFPIIHYREIRLPRHKKELNERRNTSIFVSLSIAWNVSFFLFLFIVFNIPYFKYSEMVIGELIGTYIGGLVGLSISLMIITKLIFFIKDKIIGTNNLLIAICPYCKQKYNFSEKVFDKKIECPECGSKQIVER